jgi:hypothetical protein
VSVSGSGRKPKPEVSLVSLLAVHESVLRRHGVPSAQHTRFSNVLLRLSAAGDADADWRAKLATERLVLPAHPSHPLV